MNKLECVGGMGSMGGFLVSERSKLNKFEHLPGGGGARADTVQRRSGWSPLQRRTPTPE